MGLGSMAIGPSRDLWPDLPRFAALMTLVFQVINTGMVYILIGMEQFDNNYSC